MPLRRCSSVSGIASQTSAVGIFRRFNRRPALHHVGIVRRAAPGRALCSARRGARHLPPAKLLRLKIGPLKQYIASESP